MLAVAAARPEGFALLVDGPGGHADADEIGRTLDAWEDLSLPASAPLSAGVKLVVTRWDPQPEMERGLGYRASLALDGDDRVANGSVRVDRYSANEGKTLVQAAGAHSGMEEVVALFDGDPLLVAMAFGDGTSTEASGLCLNCW